MLLSGLTPSFEPISGVLLDQVSSTMLPSEFIPRVSDGLMSETSSLSEGSMGTELSWGCVCVGIGFMIAFTVLVGPWDYSLCLEDLLPISSWSTVD